MSEPETKKPEFTGKTMNDALEAAAAHYGLDHTELEITVLEEPASKFASLLGKRCRIQAAPKSAPASAPDNNFDPVQALTQICEGILPGSLIETRETEEHLILEIKGDGSGIFIGRKGETLDALQFIIQRIAQKQGWEGKRLVVESEKYRERHGDTLRDKTRRMAEKVMASGRQQTTELLNSSDRRIVHSIIKEYATLKTRSLGEGELKRVQIVSANESNNARRPRSDDRRYDRYDERDN